jgi:NAD(P)-dependent dehydrogenase (short-subunit alcohol dehydrogenase family)
MAEFNNKVAIVTGAASGIGESIARLYARGGAKVVVSDINEENGHKVVRQIQEEGGDAIFIRADVGRPEECEALVRQTVEQYGRLDIACNNAGIGGEQNLTADYSLEGWQKVIDINLNSVFYCLKYQIPAMLQNGGGAIVNIASILSQVSFANSPAYVAAKHGMLGLTKNAAVEYATQGIRINAVGPAFIQTPLLDPLKETPEVMDMLVSLHPIGRLGQPDEVAELVIWLSSEKASFVTAAYYPVDGGYLAR